MMHLVIVTAAVLFSILPCAACAQGDSVGIIRVKKKPAPKVSDSTAFTYDVFTIVEQMPEWPKELTGMTAKEFIDLHYTVPQEAFARGISGTVYVSFIVDADGALRNVKVDRGVPSCQACDAEAVRVVKLMPHWIPGFQYGKAVAVRYSIPVKFRFNK